MSFNGKYNFSSSNEQIGLVESFCDERVEVTHQNDLPIEDIKPLFVKDLKDWDIYVFQSVEGEVFVYREKKTGNTFLRSAQGNSVEALDLLIHIEALFIISGATLFGALETFDMLFKLSETEVAEQRRGRFLHFFLNDSVVIYSSKSYSYVLRLKKKAREQLGLLQPCERSTLVAWSE